MPVAAVDFNWEVPTLFACVGTDGLQLWDVNRSQALFNTSWHPESLLTCRFNPAEAPLVATTGGDNSIVLYDTRSYSALHRTVLKRRCNAVAWNPREPMQFAVGCDDSNVYSFDMRKMDEASHIYKDHLNAVMSVSYSPTGREFATGSFDRTVRIFDIRDGRSREVYHTRRMQQVYAVEFSGDAKFVISGSDDTNLRLWKAKSHVPLKTLLPREADAMQYREKLKQKYQFHGEVRRLLKHRHLPRNLFKEKKKLQIQQDSQRRKEQNRRDHTKPEHIVDIPERKARVLHVEQ
jgi:WD repeat and SOF domain-containing protein 1